MQLNRMLAIGLRQYYLIRGSFTRIVPLFIWVAIDIVLWGFITRYLNRVTDSATNFVPMMLGCVLLWDFLVRVMQGTTMAFMEDSWSRNFLNMFASPLAHSGISDRAGYFQHRYECGGSGGDDRAGGFGVRAFFPDLWRNHCAVFVYFVFLFGIALGIFGCAIIASELGPAAEWFVWPIPAIISPFACVFYPLNTLHRTGCNACRMFCHRLTCVRRHAHTIVWRVVGCLWARC